MWAALRDPPVTVDRRRVSEFMVTRDTEPQSISFRVHNIVRDVITLEFDHSFRLAALEGTIDEPREVVLWYQKTFGTSLISILRGSVVARPLDADGGAGVHPAPSNPAGSGAEGRAHVQDCSNSVAARVHGRPLPTY